MAGADGNGRVLPDAEAIQSPEADDEGELPESLEEALLDAASELPGLVVRGEGDQRQFLVGSRVVATLQGDVAEFRLDPAVATAALRTPGVRRSAAAPDQVAFEQIGRAHV